MIKYLAILALSCSLVYGDTMYVSNATSVSVVNSETKSVIQTINGFDRAADIAFTSDGATAYVANSEGNNVQIITTATGDTQSISGIGNSPLGIAIAPDDSTVYVANAVSNTVSVIDTGTNTVTNTIILNQKYPYGIAFKPDGSEVWVCNANSHTVSIIDTSNLQITQNISLVSFPTHIIFDLTGSKAYVSCLGSHKLFEIDTTSKETRSIENIGLFPSGLCLSSDGSYLYLTSTGDLGGLFNVINIGGSNFDLVKQIVTAGTPTSVAISNSTSEAFVTDPALNSLEIINLETLMLESTQVSVGTEPQYIRTNP